MKHKVKVKVPVEKNGLFGKRTIMKERMIEVDEQTYRKLRKEQKERLYSIDEKINVPPCFSSRCMVSLS